jgi:serine phosphatase RsbU (regulator of sigma subunit)
MLLSWHDLPSRQLGPPFRGRTSAHLRKRFSVLPPSRDEAFTGIAGQRRSPDRHRRSVLAFHARSSQDACVVADREHPTSHGGRDSWLVRAVLRGIAPQGRWVVWIPLAAGLVVEVALMFGLGLFGPAHVLGLPGPLTVAVAAIVGILAQPRHAALVAAAGCLAYWVFLSDFGREVHYPVVVISSVLWIGMPWLIARAGHSLRRQVLARQDAQLEVEDLYHGLEQGLLPRQRTSHPALRAATYYRPGEQRLRLGGDFFDLAVVADGSLALVVGDVSGHGPKAAAVSAMLRGTWRGAVTAGMPGTDVARLLHHIVTEEAPEDAHATALIAVIDPDGTRIDAITAGHPAPLLLAGDIASLPMKRGVPLGVGDLADAWPVTSIDLPATWTLFFYTDGLVEMRARPGESERFEVEGLIAQLEAGDGRLLTRDHLRDLVEAMATQGGEGPADDVAIVVVSR